MTALVRRLAPSRETVYALAVEAADRVARRLRGARRALVRARARGNKLAAAALRGEVEWFSVALREAEREIEVARAAERRGTRGDGASVARSAYPARIPDLRRVLR